MRILAGGPARETESEMFRLHVEGLEAQASVPADGFDTDPHFDVTIRHEVVPDDDGPRWHAEKIERVAKVRQGFVLQAVTSCECGHPLTYPQHDHAGSCTLCDECTESAGPQFDALFLVDTDVILGPGVLERMWAVDADVVFGVFWTEADWGQPVGPVAPQVWRAHPYRFDEPTWEALMPTCPCTSSKWHDGEGRLLPAWRVGALCRACEMPAEVNEVEVYGGGACTLIRGRGFESRYWPLLESVRWNGAMWGGEDRTYALGLETRGIAQVAVTGLPIVHLHHEHQQTPEALERARQEVGL